MKKYLLSALVIIGCSFMLFSLKSLIFKNGLDIAHVSAAIFGTDSSATIPSETGVKGSTSNPFVVLEIVPYEGYAEIGYMIKGCEPVPMDKLAFSSEDGAAVASTTGMQCTWEAQYTFDLPTGDKIGTAPGEWENIGTSTQYGYYEKVKVGEGNFKQQISGTTITFIETKAGDGNYIWIPYEVNKPDPSRSTDYTAEQVHTSRLRTYYRRYHNTFTYNNKFLINAVGVTEDQIDNYKIQVVTMTPKELNLAKNQEWIDRADLIFISPSSHFSGNSLVKVWEKYHPDKVVTTPPTNFTGNDFTWETTVKILKKASTDADTAPVVFDVRVFTEDNSYYNSTLGTNTITPVKKYSTGKTVDFSIASKGYTTNVAKLYMIMQQTEPAKFVRDYIDSGQVVPVKIKTSGGSIYKNGSVEMTTGYYKEQYTGTISSSTYYQQGKADPAAVWSIYTFLPLHLFANYAALDSGKVWETVGIDNYRVIVDGGASNVSVRHNFYSYNGDNSLTIILLNPMISPNRYSQDCFDYYNRKTGTLTPAQAIQYLLNLEPPVYEVNTLRILEIEPCNDFIWDGTGAAWSVTGTGNGSAYARQYFTKFVPNYRGNLIITKMTSQEFIGRIDDLNSNYDMIFFGLRDGVMRKSGTTTVYNDTSLNGRVYLHNGDVIRGVASKLRGLAGSSTTDTYRFSGNDITAVKLSRLKQFLEGGNPVILDYGFYTDSTRTSVNSGYLGKIDPNSNIYDLAASNSSQLFYSDGISIRRVEALLSSSKCRIVFGKKNDSSVIASTCYPAVYRDRTVPGNEGLSDNEIYINGADPNFRTLQYKFYINKKNSGDTYTVKLYIDINADGKYDEQNENISGLNILDDEGYQIRYNGLKAGVNYTVTRTLENDYYGILPWKLVVTSNNNRNEWDCVINYCALKTQKKIELNILQIMSNSGNTVNLATQPVFRKYMDNLNDYDIKITSMTVDQFSNRCGTGTYSYIMKDEDDNNGEIKNSTKVQSRIDDDGDGIYDYNMLILGFADMYSDISNINALKNISDFIEEGNTVLFTHDTTSFVNVAKTYYPDSDFWGYGLNKYFRNIFGMDRFGVTLSTATDRISSGKDYASDKSDHTGYIQGYSNLVLNRYAPAQYNYVNQYASNTNITLGSSFESNFTTNTITGVNKGQLTMYPYKIDDSFPVATTHSQYYQLDLEKDDIVVWYCLSDSKGGSGFYSTTPNDVRNNYYIYNKGNITYSGVGHSALNTDINDTAHHMEIKLFVNTIIAAYTATAKDAEIIITNPDKSVDSQGKEYVYVDYDIYNTQQAVGTDVAGSASQYQRIRYRVMENNILFNKVLTVKYYYADTIKNADGTTQIKETPIDGITTKRMEDDVAVSSLAKGDVIDSGEEYYFEVPLSELNNSNSGRTFIIRVETTYGKASDKTTISDKMVTLVRRGLFDLD